MVCYSRYGSPLGEMLLRGETDVLTGLWFMDQKGCPALPADLHDREEFPIVQQTFQWLDLYFAGIVPDFLPPLRWTATPFRDAVWRRLLTIPYGTTITYGQLAKTVAEDLGCATMSPQAVGGAVGNKIQIGGGLLLRRNGEGDSHVEVLFPT